MKENYELLVEKEEIWAKMYIQLLEQNSINYQAIPVNGAGLSMTTGTQDYLKIYIPQQDLKKAQELINTYFPKDNH